MKILLFIFLSILNVSAFAAPGVVAHVNLSPAGNFQAKTDQVIGTAVLDGDKLSAKNVKVPLAGLKTGIDLRDKHMKDKYLEVEKYPEAELIEASGSDGNGKGRLKIRGIEKEIAGTYRIVNDKEVEVKFPLKLSDYGITGIRYLGVGVKDETQVTVTLPVSKATTPTAPAKR